MCATEVMCQDVYRNTIFIFIYLFTFWPRYTACGILVPRPGSEPVPPALEARSLNHWTAREAQETPFFKK